MAEKSKRVRRGLGLFCLAAAVGQLIAGETLLAARLHTHPWEFLLFWLACFLFVGLAFLLAVVDLVVVRRQARDEERELAENTIREITEASETKSANHPHNSVK